jgi:hypothetical protein
MNRFQRLKMVRPHRLKNHVILPTVETPHKRLPQSIVTQNMKENLKYLHFLK